MNCILKRKYELKIYHSWREKLTRFNVQWRCIHQKDSKLLQLSIYNVLVFEFLLPLMGALSDLYVDYIVLYTMVYTASLEPKELSC